MVPPAQIYELPSGSDLHAASFLAAADHREAERVGGRGEHLVVLAECEVVERGTVGLRHAVEIDYDAAARAFGDVRRVPADSVGDVEQRVRNRSEPLALVAAKR